MTRVHALELSRMKASIITPTFNSRRFIDACVENVRMQGSAVLEHIIVDGGSTDGTVEHVQEFARADPKIRLIGGPDQGQSDALNKGSRAAQGDVIGILNSDDSYEPEAVSRGLAALATLAAPGLVVGDCLIHNEDGSSWWNRPSDLRLESLLLGWTYAPHPVNPSAYFYHREVHNLVGGYDVGDHYAMDVDFVLKCVVRVKTRYVGGYWGNFQLMPGCKTHDDAHGPQRTREIAQRFREQLGPVRRANMVRIKTAKDLRMAVRRLRHKLAGAS